MTEKPTYVELEQRILTLEKALSERERTDEMFPHSGSIYRELVENNNDVFYQIDQEGTITYISPSVESLLGYTLSELMDIPITSFLHPDDRDRIVKGFQDVLIGRLYPSEWRVRTKSGEYRWVRTFSRPIRKGNQYQGVQGILSDITDLKFAEEALKSERDLIQRMMETSPAGITRVDAGGQVLYANKRAEEIFGIKLSQTTGRTYNDPAWHITDFDGNHFPEESLPFNVVKKTGKSVFGIQHAIEWPDGKRVLLSINSAPFFNISGEFDGMVSTIEDITEKYETEQNYQMLFREMIEGFSLHEIICNDQGHPVDYRFLAVNPGFERLTGLRAETIIGRSVLEVLPNTESYWVEKFGQVALTGEPVFFENYSQEIDRFFQVSAFRPAKNQFACIFVDITERKKTEEEKLELEKRLQQAQKMESIGTLAGGIAHDFNNILGIILGNTELAMLDVPEWNSAHTNLREVRNACMRARDVVKQILAFSRQTDHELKPIQIDTVISDSLRLMRSTIPSTIDIHQKIREKSGAIMGDATQINQILLNLCTNASHAMREKGGILDVTLDHIHLDDDDTNVLPDLTAGDYIKLSVNDTGHGIPSDMIHRVFDPYFTTKEIGEGTGMGLAVAHGIVKQHNGAIMVRSEMGKGTTFDVYFPMIKNKTDEIPEISENIMGGQGYILFVDDEPAMVNIYRSMLERIGYKVFGQSNSLEALEAFKKQADEFDLVITDQTMPHLTGQMLAKEIMVIRPDIPIILCTGHSDMIDEDLAYKMGIKAFIMKPLVMSEISRVIQDVMNH